MTVDAGTVALTLLSLVAFASNSILTRLAIGAHQIDPASFTVVRILSGAIALAWVVRATGQPWSSLRPRDISGPLVLIVYAIPFSLAYARIGAAVGALLLFGAVQLTMISYAVTKGERPGPLAWAGLLLATAGLAFLTLRSAARPDPAGVVLMLLAGAAWGVYSIAGRTEADPIASNARNFVWSAPLALLLPGFATTTLTLTGRGVALAAVSGGLTSGLGYTIWYRALRRLTVTQASVAQLSVPALAAFGAVVFLGEPLTPRLIASAAMVLGGIGLVLASRARRVRPPAGPAARL